ncbi:MAG: hypothetical protein L6Q81_08095 [Bacteroidia bacterium]|nr:hypothetical protein [Bacteroidia bacterium]
MRFYVYLFQGKARGANPQNIMGNCIVRPILYCIVAFMICSCNEEKGDCHLSSSDSLLYITYTSIDSLPEDLSRVVMLDLSEQNLEKVPDVVFDLPNLQVLNLSGNRLSYLTGINALSKLEILNIGSNNFTSFPVEITSLSNLKSLSLHWNNFEQFPDEFYFKNQAIEELNMTSLRNFDFQTCLPKVLHMPNLKRLNLSGPINLQSSDFSVCSNLQELGIIWQDSIDLDLLFRQLEHCPNLRIIHLSGSNISELPPSIANLKRLERLNLFRNNLTKLPYDITSMKQLKEITLIDNPVDTLQIKPIEDSLHSTQIIY